ncbi:P-loop containing nucleoside triphosphate hydrolase protein [Xylariales sp. PMI_506]|nr:P-loop containing nucleoside triphosphate hydrolase protein [Xylariales sp. PMI_506]
MDYRSIHGQDVSSFDLPSTHRLPTVSAASALEELRSDRTRFIPTSITELDQALNPSIDDVPRDSVLPGGFPRGSVAEIWGPPASGTTHFGLQLAANALLSGAKVVWVDAFRPFCGRRLSEILDAAEARTTSSPATGGSTNGERISDLIHFTCPSLAHFIALLCRPHPSCIPRDAALVVIDSLSALVSQTFPKVQEPRNAPKGSLSTSMRRLQVIQSMIGSLQKLAATQDLAIIVLSHCATKMQAARGATLVPAINTSSWEQGIATRLVLFRDWSFKDDVTHGARFVGIQKLNGVNYAPGLGAVYAFDIHTKGLIPAEHDTTQSSLTLSSAHRSKRKLGETGFEIADSEDEESYGWEDEDAAEMPPMPSQWQGSEDIMLGQHDDEGNRIEDSDDQSVQSEYSHRPGTSHDESYESD